MNTLEHLKFCISERHTPKVFCVNAEIEQNKKLANCGKCEEIQKFTKTDVSQY